MVNWNNKNEVKDYINLRARQLGMPESFIPIYIKQLERESGLMHYVNRGGKTQVKRGGSGEYGIGQLMPETAKSLGVKNPSDPAQNIDGSIKYMINALAHYNGDVNKALMAYNAGFGAVDSGKIPKQSITYAKEILGGVPTGAAAPVSDIPTDDSLGDRMSNLVQGNVDLATQGISNYASTPYNPSMALALRAQRQREYEDMLNKIVRETPINPTPEQVSSTSQPFNQNVQNMALASADAMNRIQGLTGTERYQPYEEKIRQAYENQISRLEAANPYTQLSNIAPVNPVDLDLMNRRYGVQDAMNVFGASLGLNTPAPNYADLQNKRAMALRAAEIYNKTGLTPEQFIAGQTANYNQMALKLAAQNKDLNTLYVRATQGDIQAMQEIQQIATNLNANMTSNAANQATAQHQLRQDQLAAEKENRERYFDMLKQIQGLDVPMVQEGGAQQRVNTTTAGSMYNTGLTSGTNAAGNLASYEGRMISGQDANVIKAPTPQQVISTYGQVAGMSNDPTAVQNWANAAGQAYSAAGVPDAYLLPFLNNQSQK